MADHPPARVRIDSTPTLPKPPGGLIDAASREIPRVLANVNPNHKGKIELVAAGLAKRVRDSGHLLAAARWAIHEAVLAGRLLTGPVETVLPSFGRPSGPEGRMVWTGGQQVTVAIIKGKPTPFDDFKVVATEALWEWWHSRADSQFEQVDGSVEDHASNEKFKGSRRKKAEYDTVQREAKLVAEWERARVAGVYKADFARDKKLTSAKFNLLLGRVRKRNSRADN